MSVTMISRGNRTMCACAVLLVWLFVGSPALFGQGFNPRTPLVAPLPQATVPADPPPHHFWDRRNDWLFAGVGAARALDYASTLNMRRRGDNEIFLTNQIVDNHPLFAGIEIGTVVVSVGTSYLFHRTGHHRLERWVSIVHIGVATGGAVRNYALKTAHPPS